MANFFRISKKENEVQAFNLDKVDYITMRKNDMGEVSYTFHMLRGEHEKTFELPASTKGLREKLGFTDQE